MKAKKRWLIGGVVFLLVPVFACCSLFASTSKEQGSLQNQSSTGASSPSSTVLGTQTASVSTTVTPTLLPTVVVTETPSPSQSTTTVASTPTAKPNPTATPKQKPTTKPAPQFVCDCTKTCPEMISCKEAQYQLNVCGCTKRDADHDGVACDADCQ